MFIQLLKKGGNFKAPKYQYNPTINRILWSPEKCSKAYWNHDKSSQYTGEKKNQTNTKQDDHISQNTCICMDKKKKLKNIKINNHVF